MRELGRRLCAPSLAVLAATSCGHSSSAPKPRGIVHAAQDYGYPMDDVLRINHVQAKGTHNSYHIETPGVTDGELEYSHPPLDVQADASGVRGFELDPRFIASTGRFEVFHLPLVDEGTNCRALVDCLSTLRRWSDAHPAHEPLIMALEPKDNPPPDDPESYFTELETEILSVWPRERIVAPDDVQQGAPTLRDGVTTTGFPTLGQTRGCILFYVDNQLTWRDLYTRGGASLEGRLLFVDGADTPGGPLEAVLLLNDPADGARIADAARAGFLVRTVADEAGDANDDRIALTTSAHVLTTDLEGTFNLPSGTPSRCNPVAAPAGCTPQAIEDPAHLR
jgi:hypothetical protein